jgi:DNA-cytosine methyltransferase
MTQQTNADTNFTHLGLFEGIGGFSLAARWMGWQTLAWCEWNEFGQKVLKHHFPNAEGFGDITKTDFTKYANRIDILTGGFPCQPYSLAGKRKGKEDDRHLWPEMLRAIREIQPRWVVGENVLGLVNWSGGLVFHEEQADLEAAGYEVWPYLLPAVSVDAPHRRDRVWFVAYASVHANGLRTEGGMDMGGELLERRERKQKANGFDEFGKDDATDSDRDGLIGSDCEHEEQSGEGGLDAQRDVKQGVKHGDVTDSDRRPTGTPGEGGGIERGGCENDD